jgi:uncharacterized membrane protein
VSGARSLPVITLLTGLLLLAWPFLIWFGLAHNGLRWLLPLMALCCFYAVVRSGDRRGRYASSHRSLRCRHHAVLCQLSAQNAPAAAVLPGGGEQRHASGFWRFAVVSYAAGRTPGTTARTRPSRNCRALYPPSDTNLVRFFIVNGSIALFTALHGDMSIWTAWNGMLSYLLMGMLMAGEWLVRRRVMKRDNQ